MNEFRHKILDLRTDDRDLLLNSFKKCLDKTMEVNDKDFEESLNDLGRFVLALLSAKRISFKILHPNTEDNENIKYEAIS